MFLDQHRQHQRVRVVETHARVRQQTSATTHAYVGKASATIAIAVPPQLRLLPTPYRRMHASLLKFVDELAHEFPQRVLAGVAGAGQGTLVAATFTFVSRDAFA